jgi:hypothetical protein
MIIDRISVMTKKCFIIIYRTFCVIKQINDYIFSCIKKSYLHTEFFDTQCFTYYRITSIYIS